MKKKAPLALPNVSRDEVTSLPKDKAILLRLTAQDKDAIEAAASALRLTTTEFLTKAALLVASKVEGGK